MLGALGAAACVLGGAACGLILRERRRARLALLEAQACALAGMRLMLQQERLKMGDLLSRAAELTPAGAHTARFGDRLRHAAGALALRPLDGVAGAYRAACAALPIPWEQPAERELMDGLFSLLGSGTAAMREQAATLCLKRMQPLIADARARLARGGALCVRLGALMGLMLGVALW